MESNTVKIRLADDLDRSELFGNMDSNLDLIREHLKIDIIQRDNELILKGDDTESAEKVINELIGIIASGEKLDEQKTIETADRFAKLVVWEMFSPIVKSIGKDVSLEVEFQ